MNRLDFLREKLIQQYGKENVSKIFDGFSCERAVTLRANLLKSSAEETAEMLKSNGIKFETVSWSSEAFILNDAYESGVWKLSAYEEGKIYLQSLSSMLPPIILNPQNDEDILDMAAAPGGKTTQLAALSGCKAHITACERNKIRAEKLKYNLKKQGANSVYVMVQDARKLDDFFSFDKILLDAPCSGSGTLDLNNEKQSASFSEELVTNSAALQTAMLKKAVKLLKRGGELVYSTCSLLECENEDNVRKILSAGLEIVPIEFEGMNDIPQLPVTVKGALCVMPAELYEGFFVCKMRKM